MKLSSLLLSALAAAMAYLPGAAASSDSSFPYHFPNTITEGYTSAQLNSAFGYNMWLETPKVSPAPNRTGFDWWYFDAVNRANVNETVVIIFYLATNDSFPLRSTPDNAVSVDIFLTFGDGSSSLTLIDAAKGDKGAATLGFDMRTNLTSGNWHSTGFTFSEYRKASGETGLIVKVDNPRVGVKGSLKLKTTSNPHFPCTDEVKSGNQTLEAAPQLGWANSIPDADATAHFTRTVDNSTKTLEFTTGVGYHDQMWSVRPFQQNVKDYYWGHARVGHGVDTYSIVWMYSVDHAGVISSNAYIGGRSYFTACDRGSSDPNAPGMVVKVGSHDNHAHISFQVNDGREFNLLIEKNRVLGKYGPFTRWSGKALVFPPIEGIRDLAGVGLFQEFHF